jgi:hypothetical protein
MAETNTDDEWNSDRHLIIKNLAQEIGAAPDRRALENVEQRVTTYEQLEKIPEEVAGALKIIIEASSPQKGG